MVKTKTDIIPALILLPGIFQQSQNYLTKKKKKIIHCLIDEGQQQRIHLLVVVYSKTPV